MGNEIMSQNMLNYGYSNPAMMNSFGGNMLASMGMGQLNGMTDYSNDMFAPDFIKQPVYNTGYTNTQQSVPSVNSPNQSIFTTPQNQINSAPVQSFTGIEEEIQQTEQGNETEKPPKTNIGKSMGTIAGLSIPVLSSASKLISGAKFTDVFKFKELGLKAAGLALIGWCAGALIDGFLNSNQSGEKA